MGEATALRSPCTATREWSPPAATKREPMCRNEDPVQPKINKIVLKIINKQTNNNNIDRYSCCDLSQNLDRKYTVL